MNIKVHKCAYCRHRSVFKKNAVNHALKKHGKGDVIEIPGIVICLYPDQPRINPIEPDPINTISITSMGYFQKVKYQKLIHREISPFVVDPKLYFSRTINIFSNLLFDDSPKGQFEKKLFRETKTLGDLYVTAFRLYAGDLAHPTHRHIWRFNSSRNTARCGADLITVIFFDIDEWKGELMNRIRMISNELIKEGRLPSRHPEIRNFAERIHTTYIKHERQDIAEQMKFVNGDIYSSAWEAIKSYIPVIKIQ